MLFFWVFRASGRQAQHFWPLLGARTLDDTNSDEACVSPSQQIMQDISSNVTARADALFIECWLQDYKRHEYGLVQHVLSKYEDQSKETLIARRFLGRFLRVASQNFSTILDSFVASPSSDMDDVDVRIRVKTLMVVLSYCSQHKECSRLLGIDKRLWFIVDLRIFHGSVSSEVVDQKCYDQERFFIFLADVVSYIPESGYDVANIYREILSMLGMTAGSCSSQYVILLVRRILYGFNDRLHGKLLIRYDLFGRIMEMLKFNGEECFTCGSALPNVIPLLYQV